MKKLHIIKKHHRLHGRDHNLVYPVMIVDGQNVRGHAAATESEEKAYRRRERRHNDENKFRWPRPVPVDLENMARDAFGRIDDIHHEVLNEQDQQFNNADNDEGEGNGDEVNLEYLARESSERLFEGST